MKQHKHFLDVLAMQAGKKKYNPRQPEGSDPALLGLKKQDDESTAFIT